MNLAEKINYLMKKNNIKNPKELSTRLKEKELAIPYTTLLTIINNEVQDIKLGTAKKLSTFFNVTLDELLDDNLTLDNTFKYASYNGINEDGLDENDIEEINRFVEFIKNKKKNEKK
jgi:hypothetical protein